LASTSVDLYPTLAHATLRDPDKLEQDNISKRSDTLNFDRPTIRIAVIRD
jgi:hypothetical protein